MCKEDYIGTYTDKHFHFLSPSEDEIDIEDISHALSMNCRFNGHVKYFYSVAEHSCIIADIVHQRTGDVKETLSALLHDASEAYLCDIPRPLKPYLTNYMEMEKTIELVIQSKYDITAKTKLIEYLDCNIVADEAAQLFKTVPTWVDHYVRLGVKIHKWTPEQASVEFLRRFNELTAQLNNSKTLSKTL